MMDIKEIIKWFIPCFHIFLKSSREKMNAPIVFMTLITIFDISAKSLAAKIHSDNAALISRDSLISEQIVELNLDRNISKSINIAKNLTTHLDYEETGSLQSTGRTFGRPFKKMMAGFIPLVFQMGMAATWAVVAALVGIKTLAVAMVILKLLLIAGAVKVGTLFGSKHSGHGWEQPHQKEIHLHIHNNGHQDGHEEQIVPWSREGISSSPPEAKNEVVFDPYSAGPQTISTPYGNYVNVDHLKSLFQKPQ